MILKQKIMSLFNFKKTKLFNGKTIKEGDSVYLIDSDNIRRKFTVKKRESHWIHSETGKKLKKGTLFFCNIAYEPTDYKNADIF